MNIELTAEAQPAERTASLPWISFLVIGAVFFYTGHHVKYTAYFAESGVEGYIVNEEQALEIMTRFEEGSARNAVAYVALGAAGLLWFALWRRNQLVVNGLCGGFVLLFIGWSFLSATWADVPIITLKKLAILGMLCLAIAGVLRRFSDRDIVFLILLTTGAYLILGVGSEIALGSFRPWVSGYRFSGTCHPNGQGLNCAMLFLTALYGMTREERHRRLLVAIAVAAFTFLLLTKSRTCLMATLMTVVFYRLLLASWLTTPALLCLIAAIICFAHIFADTLAPVLGKAVLLGRTDTAIDHAKTFTGRTELWGDIVSTHVPRHPILGFGYNSFWSAENTFDIADSVGWIAGYAHSAYLDLMLGLGLVGLLAYVIAHVMCVRNALAYYGLTRDPVYPFYWSIIVFSLCCGLMESTFLFSSMPTFLAMLVVARLAFQPPPEASAEEEAQGA